MTENEQKLEFARALVRDETNPYKAALAVFGANTGQALRVYMEWVNDPLVRGEVSKLKETHGKRQFMSDAEDTAAKADAVYKVAMESGQLDIALKALRAYSDIMGYIQKPGTTINNNNHITHVMEVEKHGSDENWEDNLVKQQAILTNEASESVH